MTQTPIALTLTCLLLLASTAGAGWLADQRLATELRQNPDLQGEIVSLSAGDTPFVGIYRKHRRGQGRGAVILVHGPWGNPDEPMIIRPLRLALAEAGWDTLAIQMPSAYRSQTTADWLASATALQARIAAAAAWLKNIGQLNQVLLAHGPSATVAVQYAAGAPDGELQALILISSLLEKDSAGLEALAKLKIPVLDITAQRDHPAVLDNKALRRSSSADNPAARLVQREIADARPDFRGAQQVLVATIRAWLAATADGQVVPAVRR